MNKLDELIIELCPGGVEYTKFGEIAHIVRGASPRPISSYVTDDENGVNWIKIGDVRPGDKYITSTKGKITHAGAEKSRFVKPGDFVLSNSMSFGRPYIMKINGCIHDGWLAISNFDTTYIPDFLYYLLGSNKIQQEMSQRASNGTVQNLNADIVKSLNLPLPPLAVQVEIVRILDNFTELTVELIAELKAECTARKKQYEYYRDDLLSFGDIGIRWVKLGEIADVTKLAGFEFTEHIQYSNEGTTIALRGLNVKKGYLDLSQVKYIDGSNFSKLSRSKLIINDMLFTYVGTVGQVALIDKDDEYYLAPNVSRIRFMTNEINPVFMRYYFQTNNFINTQINKYMESSSMKNLTMENIRKFTVPIPSLKEQERIVTILDRFDTLCNNLTSGLPAEIEARRKQYEYYRDKLLNFQEV